MDGHSLLQGIFPTQGLNPGLLPSMEKTQVQSLSQKDPLKKGMAIHFLPGEFNGQRSLAGYNPWGHKESDTTERLTLTCYGQPMLAIGIFTLNSLPK